MFIICIYSKFSLGLKTFGNDVYYRHLHGEQSILDTLRSADPRILIQRLNSGEVNSIHTFYINNLVNKIFYLIATFHIM